MNFISTILTSTTLITLNFSGLPVVISILFFASFLFKNFFISFLKLFFHFSVTINVSIINIRSCATRYVYRIESLHWNIYFRSRYVVERKRYRLSSSSPQLNAVFNKVELIHKRKVTFTHPANLFAIYIFFFIYLCTHICMYVRIYMYVCVFVCMCV